MTIKRAIEVLTEYNKWRRGNHEPCDCKYSALEVGAAIDVATLNLWKMLRIHEIVLTTEGVEVNHE
jgi:hypothetical protein